MNTDEAQRERIREILAGFSTAMLVTRGRTGLRARPMVVADVAEQLELWFVTGEDSAKVHEIVEDTHAYVVCQKDPCTSLFLTGTATVIKDHRRAAELWRESFRIWFPDGRNDPSLVLIRFRPEAAEYWDHSSLHRLAGWWKCLRACVTGLPPHRQEPRHGLLTVA